MSAMFLAALSKNRRGRTGASNPREDLLGLHLIDPVTKDFLAATEGHTTIMNFSTIPAWMFKTDKPVTIRRIPNQVFWNYTQGTELRDPTGKELGDYFGRLVSWYTKGGFTDENGKRHDSGYHYKFPYWEVLNEWTSSTTRRRSTTPSATTPS